MILYILAAFLVLFYSSYLFYVVVLVVDSKERSSLYREICFFTLHMKIKL